MVVIKDADTMTLRAQNRLLKTLEEPFEGTVMILLSENRENLLETIKSRCVLYRIEGEKQETAAGESAEALFQTIAERKGFFRSKEVLSENFSLEKRYLPVLNS